MVRVYVRVMIAMNVMFTTAGSLPVSYLFDPQAVRIFSDTDMQIQLLWHGICWWV